MGRIRSDAVPFRPSSNGAGAKVGTRPIVFAHETHETPVLHRSRIRPGEQWDGPLVFDEPGSNTVIPPAYRMDVDGQGNLVITRTANERGAW
jgi:N-methylhydantoinase A